MLCLLLSLFLCSIFSVLVITVLNAFGSLSQASIVLSKCSTLQALYMSISEMLARLPSLYLLVSSVFVYHYLISYASNFYLHEILYQSEMGFFSVVRVCLCLSLFKYPELSFYYCLQSSSPSLSNSVADYFLFSSPIFFMNAQMSTYCQRLLLLRHVNQSQRVETSMSTSNFLGLCCGGNGDRQRYQIINIIFQTKYVYI